MLGEWQADQDVQYIARGPRMIKQGQSARRNLGWYENVRRLAKCHESESAAPNGSGTCRAKWYRDMMPRDERKQRGSPSWGWTRAMTWPRVVWEIHCSLGTRPYIRHNLRDILVCEQDSPTRTASKSSQDAGPRRWLRYISSSSSNVSSG